VEPISRRDFIRKSALAAGAYSGAIIISPGHWPGYPAPIEPLAGLSDSSRPVPSPQDNWCGAKGLSNIPAQHPSLHFNSEALEQLRRKAEGTHSSYAKMLFEWVDQNKTWSPLDMPYPSAGEVALEQSAAFVTNVALAFVLSQQDEYLQLCRRWVAEMLEYPKNGVRNYGFGIYAAGLARVYDWLYHHLTDQERQKIRTNVVDVVTQLHKGSIPGAGGEFWWASAHMHHDHWIPVGGYGEAALALLGEVKEASTWATAAKTDFDFALSWLGDDGAWHEGAADWCYAVAPLLWFYSAWQSVIGENLHDVPWIRNTAKYRLYHWLPDDSYIYLNDSFRSGRYNTSGSASCHLLRRLASLFQDGYAQWLADRDEAFDMRPGPKGVYQAPYEKLSYTGEPKDYPYTQSQCVAWNVLWYDPKVVPIPPENLPRAEHFENQGVVIMRTGWKKDAAVISLSCAPLAGQKCAERIRKGEQISSRNYGHAHADYNAFTLFACGQYFIIPPGYARRSSAFQNVVTVNGADFVVDPSIKVQIVALRKDARFSYAVGDATEAFLPHLAVQRYRRHILLLERGWMVLFDDLQLSDIASRRRNYNNFVWMVYSDPSTHQLAIKENKAIWTARSDDKSTLSMQLLEPQDLAWERATLQSTGGINMLEALRLKRPEWYSNQMRVLSIWSWQDDLDAPTLLRHSDFIAVLWRKPDDVPAVGFAVSTKALSSLSHPELRGRELLLFGHDPARPDSFVSVKNGKVIEN